VIRVALTSQSADWERAHAIQRAWLWLGKGVRAVKFLPAPVPLSPAFVNIRPLLPKKAWYQLLDGHLGYRGCHWIKELNSLKGAVLVINARFANDLEELQFYVTRNVR
jgi:hypothetical protein